MEFSENLVHDLIADIAKEKAKNQISDENIIIVKALKEKGCIIEKIYFREGETKPIISYVRRKYQVSLTSTDSKVMLEEMCLIAAIIVFGKEVLNKYECFQYAKDFFMEYPGIKEYYNQILEAAKS